MRESSSSDDINVRKESLILKHRDTGQPRNYGFVVIILSTLTFSCSAHNENIYKELICHQLGKELLVSDLFVFHLGFHFISLSNPVSSQPLPNPNPVPRENNVPLFSFASLLCCCCVIKTYRWKAVHLLPSPIQSSN